MGSSHSEFVQFLGTREPFGSLLDEEGCDAFVFQRGFSLGVDDQHICIRAVGDPHFAAVENVFVSFLHCTEFHGCHI